MDEEDDEEKAKIGWEEKEDEDAHGGQEKQGGAEGAQLRRNKEE